MLCCEGNWKLGIRNWELGLWIGTFANRREMMTYPIFICRFVETQSFDILMMTIAFLRVL